MPGNRSQPVDIEGLKDALSKQGVSVSEMVAKRLKQIDDLAEDEEPSKAKQFQATIAFGSLRALAQLMKARPEVVAKSAGRVSSDELVGSLAENNGQDIAGQPTRQPPARLPKPGDG